MNTIATNLFNGKSTGFLAGLCFAGAACFFILERTWRDEKIEEEEIIYESVPQDEDMIPVTIQEEQQPAAPVVNNNVTPEVLQIVEDEVEIKEEKIETSEEVNQVIIGTEGTGAPTITGAVQSAGPVVEEVDDNRILEVPEVMASYPGGDDALYKWLYDHIKYPSRAQDQGIQGRVMVKFVVEKDGSIGNVQITRSPDEDLSKEATRVIKMMPKWKPARQGTRTVRSYFNLPVMFRLQ